MVLIAPVPDYCLPLTAKLQILARVLNLRLGKMWLAFILSPYEPRSEKTGLRGFRPGPKQTGLYSHRRWLGLKFPI